MQLVGGRKWEGGSQRLFGDILMEHRDDLPYLLFFREVLSSPSKGSIMRNQ